MRRAYALAYGRPASEADVQLTLRYLAATDAADAKAMAKLSRWERLAQALLGSNEFLYID